MNRQRSRRRGGLTWLLATGWLLLVPMGLVAQQAAAKPARSVPDLVTVRLTAPGGETFEATAWEGDAVTFHSTTLGIDLALVPTVQDQVLGDVRIDLYPLQNDGSVTRIAGEVERLDVQLGLRSVATSLVDVEVTEIRPATAKERAGYRHRATTQIDLIGGIIVRAASCCVSCGGDEVCGCRVLSGCGSCCSSCCGALAK